MATPTLPRQGVNGTGCAPATLVLNIANRPAIEAAIEHLLAILDAQDGDPDLEQNGDMEPDNDGEDLFWLPMALSPFGTPITSTFTNPHGQTGRFIGIESPQFVVTDAGRQALGGHA